MKVLKRPRKEGCCGKCCQIRCGRENAEAYGEGETPEDSEYWQLHTYLHVLETPSGSHTHCSWRYFQNLEDSFLNTQRKGNGFGAKLWQIKNIPGFRPSGNPALMGYSDQLMLAMDWDPRALT